MNVNVRIGEELIVGIDLGREHFGEGVGDAHRLFHDVAHVAGQLHPAAAALLVFDGPQRPTQRRFNVQRRTSHGSPGQTHYDARWSRVVEPVGGEDGPADKVSEVAVVDGDGLRLALDELEGGLAEDLLHLLLQVAHAALPAVGLDQRLQGLAVDRQLGVRHPRVPFGLRDEVLGGDVHLLFGHVARHLNHFHTIPQWLRNRIQHVGSADEQHLT